MLSLTVDQISPILQLLPQPAFCIRTNDGTILSNISACNMAPASADELPTWLGKSALLYSLWNKESGLELPVTVAGVTYTASIHPLIDGIFFLLNSDCRSSQDNQALYVAAQVMRHPLTELSIVTQALFSYLDEAENRSIQEQTAAVNRQLYRLMRLSGNLGDLSAMYRNQYRTKMETVDLKTFFSNLEREYRPLCQAADKQLVVTEPENPLLIDADSALLERMVSNLISNAIKFGSSSQPISIWTEAHRSHVLIRVRNHCEKEDRDLLSAAFSRMEQRGVIPEPKWGMGLGLPLVRSICQLHGGTVALEKNKAGFVTVSASLTTQRKVGELIVRSPILFERSGGIRRSMVELSDVLPIQSFLNHSL